MPSSPASTHSDDEEHARKLCKIPGSRLIFASYDKSTGSGEAHVNAFSNLSLHDEDIQAKRIVVEIPPNGACSWRFVPQAIWEDGVRDEGTWPRQVNLCGEVTELTQDEWDMYKIDSDYICVVKRAPDLPTITSAPQPPQTPRSPRSPVPPLRHRIHKIVPPVRKPSQKPSQKRPIPEDLDSNSSEESETDGTLGDDMDLDFDSERKHLDSDLLKKVRKNKAEARKFRRSKNAQFKRDHPPRFNPEPEPVFYNVHVSPDVRMLTPQNSFTELPRTPPGSPSPARPAEPLSNPRKRTVSVESDDDEGDSFERSQRSDRKTAGLYDFSGEAKRSKVLSPRSIYSDLRQKRDSRGKKRQAELKSRVQTRAEDMNEKFMHDLFSEAARERSYDAYVDEDYSMEHDVPGSSSAHTYQDPEPEPEPEPSISDEEELRQAELEESRRKMAELEADRPLWEEAARQRAAREEEEQRQREAYRRAKEAQEEAARRAAKEEEQRREADRLAQEQEQQRSSVRARRLQMQADALDPYRSRHSLWNNYKAVNRFIQLSDAFDQLNFRNGDLIVFETIPWPMLGKPGSYGVEDINWQEVERFFDFARGALTPPNFKVAVDKTHKRFHPDRWRSRRVLACVEEEEERLCLELAANTVAQALTPLWKEVTGR